MTFVDVKFCLKVVFQQGKSYACEVFVEGWGYRHVQLDSLLNTVVKGDLVIGTCNSVLSKNRITYLATVLLTSLFCLLYACLHFAAGGECSLEKMQWEMPFL